MAADKYVEFGTGGALKEVQALDTSVGAGSSGRIVALDAIGKINSNMLPNSFDALIFNAETAQVLAIGDLVYFRPDGTIGLARASAPELDKTAVGYATEVTAIGIFTDVRFDGIIEGLSGLTVGSRYYLDAANDGKLTITPPDGAGEIAQVVGWAISTTQLLFRPQIGVIQG